MTNHLIDEVLGYVTTLTVQGASCGASIESGVDAPVRSLSNARYASRWMEVRGQSGEDLGLSGKSRLSASK